MISAKADWMDEGGCGCKVGWVDVDAARLAALHAKPGRQKKTKTDEEKLKKGEKQGRQTGGKNRGEKKKTDTTTLYFCLHQNLAFARSVIRGRLSSPGRSIITTGFTRKLKWGR